VSRRGRKIWFASAWVKGGDRLNSRERVLTAAELGQPDRVPLDFSADAPTLQRLLYDLALGTLRQLLERLHIDLLDIRGIVDPVYCGLVPQSREIGQ